MYICIALVLLFTFVCFYFLVFICMLWHVYTEAFCEAGWSFCVPATSKSACLQVGGSREVLSIYNDCQISCLGGEEKRKEKKHVSQENVCLFYIYFKTWPFDVQHHISCPCTNIIALSDLQSSLVIILLQHLNIMWPCQYLIFLKYEWLVLVLRCASEYLFLRHPVLFWLFMHVWLF